LPGFALADEADVGDVLQRVADFAVASAAMVPPAPTRFSTVICWSQISESLAVVMRAVWSTPPPGTKHAWHPLLQG